MMPEIIYHVATSLDGFIADKDGKVDWLNAFDAFADKEMMQDFERFMGSFDAILMGGHTYDFALEH
ncbi:MAG: dihydrofolate reductase family protein, partial [Verrucomicrobiae bacterium]|nr:dihydrofolate reductase family protein [Verrucomicrobiae bacterium]